MDSIGLDPDKMVSETDTDETALRRVHGVFGPHARMRRQGKFTHVLYGVETPALAASIAAWEPMDWFHTGCEHCQPFVELGAYIVWSHDGPYAYRMLKNNTYEMVGLGMTGPGKVRRS
jgi:hypothetical protein